jgi:asparagine N-glycosylation enzyme membrane subunit Stt3
MFLRKSLEQIDFAVFLLVFLFCESYFIISQNYFLFLLNVQVT